MSGSAGFAAGTAGVDRKTLMQQTLLPQHMATTLQAYREGADKFWPLSCVSHASVDKVLPANAFLSDSNPVMSRDRVLPACFSIAVGECA